MPELYDAIISYARKDSKDFAIKLRDELVEQGFEIWLDVSDMPPAIKFQSEINEVIEKSHNFIYIISPLATASEYCDEEIDLAVKLNKRIIPLLYIEGKPPSVIRSIDQIFFGKKKLENGEIQFAEPFAKLFSALNRQREYVEQHTRILVAALQWQENQKQTRYLLISEERKQAEAWLIKESLPCKPTDLHCEYICKSTINANNLLAQVFISYAIEDKDFLVKLQQTLMRHHITVWVDKADNQTLDAYQADCKEDIEKTDSFVYLVSPNSEQSEICQQQLSYAVSLNKHVVKVQNKIEKSTTSS